MVGSAGFSVVRASENEQVSGLYVHGDLYYLISTYLKGLHVYPIVGAEWSTCLPDSRVPKGLHVYPMENSLNHSVLWKTVGRATETPQERFS